MSWRAFGVCMSSAILHVLHSHRDSVADKNRGSPRRLIAAKVFVCLFGPLGCRQGVSSPPSSGERVGVPDYSAREKNNPGIKAILSTWGVPKALKIAFRSVLSSFQLCWPILSDFSHLSRVFADFVLFFYLSGHFLARVTVYHLFARKSRHVATKCNQSQIFEWMCLMSIRQMFSFSQCRLLIVVFFAERTLLMAIKTDVCSTNELMGQLLLVLVLYHSYFVLSILFHDGRISNYADVWNYWFMCRSLVLTCQFILQKKCSHVAFFATMIRVVEFSNFSNVLLSQRVVTNYLTISFLNLWQL